MLTSVHAAYHAVARFPARRQIPPYTLDDPDEVVAEQHRHCIGGKFLVEILPVGRVECDRDSAYLNVVVAGAGKRTVHEGDLVLTRLDEATILLLGCHFAGRGCECGC